ncbi:MAG: DUF378 domain-containing protein [Clostridia bacterium]|nr:DUF378 domain-containing protein [Clostridia bacterium]
MLTIISLILSIIGGINWLLVGIADFNLVSWLFAGNLYFIARIIYVLVGIAALWLIYYLVRHFSRIAHPEV